MKWFWTLTLCFFSLPWLTCFNVSCCHGYFVCLATRQPKPTHYFCRNKQCTGLLSRIANALSHEGVYAESSHTTRRSGTSPLSVFKLKWNWSLIAGAQDISWVSCGSPVWEVYISARQTRGFVLLSNMLQHMFVVISPQFYIIFIATVNQ